MSIPLAILSIHVTFTAIVPEAYRGEAKMCLRLIAETDARSVSDIAILLVVSYKDVLQLRIDKRAKTAKIMQRWTRY